MTLRKLKDQHYFKETVGDYIRVIDDINSILITLESYKAGDTLPEHTIQYIKALLNKYRSILYHAEVNPR